MNCTAPLPLPQPEQLRNGRPAAAQGLKGAKKQALARLCGYLRKNRQRMRYDEYLRAAYPIARGVIEGACRHLVKHRME